MGVHYSEETKGDKRKIGKDCIIDKLSIYRNSVCVISFELQYTHSRFVQHVNGIQLLESLSRKVEILSNTRLVNFSNYLQRSLCSHGDFQRDFRHHNLSLLRLPSSHYCCCVTYIYSIYIYPPVTTACPLDLGNRRVSLGTFPSSPEERHT